MSYFLSQIEKTMFTPYCYDLIKEWFDNAISSSDKNGMEEITTQGNKANDHIQFLADVCMFSAPFENHLNGFVNQFGRMANKNDKFRIVYFGDSLYTEEPTESPTRKIFKSTIKFERIDDAKTI